MPVWARGPEGVRSSGGGSQRGRGVVRGRAVAPFHIHPRWLAPSGRMQHREQEPAAGSGSLWPNPRSGRLQGQMERQRPGCRAAAAVLAGPLLSSFLQAARVRALQGSPAAENGSWAAEEAQGNESSEHAFFSLDYQHVQVPFEITLWIMLASLAKIGKASREGEERCLACSAGRPGDSGGAGRRRSFLKSPLSVGPGGKGTGCASSPELRALWDGTEIGDLGAGGNTPSPKDACLVRQTFCCKCLCVRGDNLTWKQPLCPSGNTFSSCNISMSQIKSNETHKASRPAFICRTCYRKMEFI